MNKYHSGKKELNFLWEDIFRKELNFLWEDTVSFKLSLCQDYLKKSYSEGSLIKGKVLLSDSGGIVLLGSDKLPFQLSSCSPYISDSGESRRVIIYFNLWFPVYSYYSGEVLCHRIIHVCHSHIDAITQHSCVVCDCC